ncbi:hypothetical protein ACF0H2_04270 [Serratia marcescens]
MAQRRLYADLGRFLGVAAGLKGARDARFAMWVTMLGMWGCRVVAGYALGIELGMGVVGVWLGMFLDWAVRGALFYWRMVSGRWLWNIRGPNAGRPGNVGRGAPARWLSIKASSR